MPGSQPPWNAPPVRRKKLSTRRAEKAARKGKAWGERIEQATQEGPEALAEVNFDRARAELNKLPERARRQAFSALGDAIETIRRNHTE
jgi:phage shock protein A